VACALACLVGTQASPVRAAVGVPAKQKVAGRRAGVPTGYSSRSIVIKLTPNAQGRATAKKKVLRAAGKLSAANGAHPKHPDALPWMTDNVCGEAARLNATKITPLVDWEFANPELAHKFGFDRMYVVHFPEGTDTRSAAQAFRNQTGDVSEAGTDAMGTVAGTIPDDAEFDRLWAMSNTGFNTGALGGLPGADIDAPAAWDIHTGAAGDVTIAIIDSGIDIHPDLTNVIAGYNADTSSNSTLTTDDCSHGTHVAGTAAGTGNNSVGVVGVSWGAKLMPVRVTAPAGVSPCGFFASSLTAGIIWAADNGADVANISLQLSGITDSDRINMQNAIDYGRSLGMISISATGNNNFCSGLGGVCYPARLPRCMAVGATTFTDLTASFANTGVEMDIAAPGDKIYSACIAGGQINQFCDCLPTFYPGCDRYAYLGGTSMATPHVSGLAALLKSFDPTLSVSELEDIITTTAEESNNGLDGWDEEVGYGRINAYQALLSAQVWPTILSSIPANGAIDARQHTDESNTVEFGVNYVDMDFPPDVASALVVGDFSVMQKGGLLAPPTVTDVQLLDADTVRVTLSDMIEPLAWTTIAHDTTGIVRIGYLPGDVNADQIVGDADVVAIVDHLLGVGDPLPEWSTDLDWSGATTPTDILTLVDLLQGAELHENALDTNLP
jgi:subtilisin family serine protease